jgi:hypothetical protein
MRPTRSAFRFEVSGELLKEDPLLAQLFKDQPSGFTIFLVKEKGVFLIIAPTQKEKDMCGILMHPNISAREGLDIQGARQELLKLTTDFHPAVQRICKYIKYQL